MYGDIIECLNCGKKFKDDINQTDKLTGAGSTYQWQGQDSREGKFKNMCPFCYGTSTRNTHEKTKKEGKFIYLGVSTHGGTKHSKNKKHVKKPLLDTEVIAKQVLGYRKPMNIKETNDDFPPGRTLPMSEPQKDEDYFQKRKSTSFVKSVKSFTPIELMERKLEAQHKELLSPPDNRGKYRGWRYDKRLKK